MIFNKDKRLNPNSDYFEYPDFNFYGIDVEEVLFQLKKDPSWKSDTEGFTWAKLFMYDPEQKKFLYEKAILWLFKRMFGSSVFDENGDPLSICNAPELCEFAKNHIMVALPVGSKGVSARVYINALKKLLTNHGVFEGVIFAAYEDNLGDRKEDISNSNGRTLTLTCIKDCTGANIPELGSFVFLRNLGDSVKFFEQATGRIGRKYPGKTNCGVFIGDLEAAINIMITIEEKISLDRDEDFSTKQIIESNIANYNYFSGRNGSWKKLDPIDFATILEELNSRGNYGINQCVMTTKAPEDFSMTFNNSVSNESQEVKINSNGNKGAKNKVAKVIEQLGLPFDDRKNPDQNWHNMKLTFTAKCRWLAAIYDVNTVSQCVDLVNSAMANENIEVLKVIGKGVAFFPTVMSDNKEVDIRYTNRWIQKFNDRKGNVESLLEMLADPIHRTDSNFIAEPNRELHRMADRILNKIQKKKKVIHCIRPLCRARRIFVIFTQSCG